MNTDCEVQVSTITGYACVSFRQTLGGVETADAERSRNVLAKKGVLVRLSFAESSHLFDISDERYF